MMTNNLIRTSVYCSGCRATKFIELKESDIPNDGKIKRKALYHENHVLTMDIDSNGVIRGETVIDVIRNPLMELVESVTDELCRINEEGIVPVQIDIYTSNHNLHRLMETIISNVFRHAIGLESETRVNMKVESKEDRTYLYGDTLEIMVGPYLSTTPDEDEVQRGIILDIREAESNHLDIEKTLSDYSWVALLIPRDKREGYQNAFSSLLQAQGKPYFIESLSNETMYELFDFVVAMTNALY